MIAKRRIEQGDAERVLVRACTVNHMQASRTRALAHIYGIDVKSLIPVSNVEIFEPSECSGPA